jgi:hypothetical protein
MPQHDPSAIRGPTEYVLPDGAAAGSLPHVSAASPEECAAKKAAERARGPPISRSESEIAALIQRHSMSDAAAADVLATVSNPRFRPEEIKARTRHMMDQRAAGRFNPDIIRVVDFTQGAI